MVDFADQQPVQEQSPQSTTSSYAPFWIAVLVMVKDSGFVNRLRQALLYKFPNSEVKITEVKYSELSYQERIDLQSDYV